MLAELAVRDLGIIPELRLLLAPGMTAFTGETGAGKTLLVQAIALLLGGRADAAMVRAGADEALVEGRFVVGDGTEVALARAVPAAGRSRAYVDGRMVPVAALAEAGAALVDLHGQHAHQSLLSAAAQREALDRLGVDGGPLAAARWRVAAIDAALADIGGDDKALARELDLLAFQVAELAAAGLADPEEDRVLAVEEDRLADATAHRDAAGRAHDAVAGDGGAVEGLSSALAALAARAPLAALEARVRALAVEADDVASELRAAAELLEDDPERLAGVQARRAVLRELCRKYGDSLVEVMGYAARAEARVEELRSSGRRAEELAGDRAEAVAAQRAAEAAVRGRRLALAPQLAADVSAHMGQLAMAGARFEVVVGDEGAGDDVRFLLAANPGEALLALTRVASGGELARIMLALRLAMQQGGADPGGGPTTLVFDEVDAGIGGDAARAVGRALAALSGPERQVLVVTHLPQVAAFADSQVAVRKAERDGRTAAWVEPVTGSARVVELSRMLSGSAGSAAARGHAEELLAQAGEEARRR